MTDQRIVAEYVLRTAQDPRRVADIIAGEQSSGTFVAIPGESAELKARSAARVDRLEEIDDSGLAPLPGATGDVSRSFAMTLSWPLANIGPSLPNLVATVAGNLFELREVAGLKLVDLHLPSAFAERYPGPAFGIEGTRRLANVEDRPLIGTIVKPSVGLGPAETAALVDQLCEGGIDFIKDDELQADGSHCPFEERLAAVMAVIARHADRTGRKVMYAVNLTGEIDEMLHRHDLVEKLGGTCVMVSLNSIGLTGMTALRRHSRLPIHAHRNGWGYLGRSPDNGWSYIAWQKLWRLIGVDHMHVNGLSNKFWEPDDSVIASAKACLSPISETRPDLVMPVFSSGQSVKQAEGTWKRLGSRDLIYCAGGGIVAHPSGIAAGVRSLREAWDAAMQGVPLHEAAAASPDLAAAVKKFA
ncbi:ribulose-bisphosphate carboxylase large subunit family protein [Aurantimonas sp. C2-6-R+9]|uniref:ribulose-bisphosphate carboxylase large subunit family protein n=1 Tax=unclassified Aurantimonas TaxID=2638230 RepID=UPI002E16DA42|nr:MULTISPECIES: ribulose-bisphosphate carboxylase large subunit family protein [unclassified Aurantimonas]MEC5292486.1 ribulose-bisphosphate carboxylase large subunit family protein [Aurantimonas sp. C2-3-R2]MEC5382689.1 ribulose-bisphosphate carboxylase large subunit family protein [Aurantimonas sp. C2-6-R+9]MEC5413518.1 ribulose-bisphosphate carboxylase large subunit family protein [Aurantimonas sp. C2-4-R8]